MAPADRRRSAVGAVFISGFFFALMGVTTKATHIAAIVGHPIPAGQVVLYRHLFGLLAVLPLQLRSGVSLLGINRRGLIARGVWGGFAVLFYFLSLQHTSLTHAQLLNYGSIVFAPLFARIFLKETLAPRTFAAIVAAMAGILLITLQHKSGDHVSALGDIYGFVSGVLAGAAITEIRRLRQSETAWSVFFYLSLVGIPIALVGCIGQPIVIPTTIGLTVLLLLGASSVAAQILFTYGFRYLRTSEGSVIGATQLVYGALAGLWIFNERFSMQTIAGGALVIVAALSLSMVPRTSLAT